VSDVGGVSDGSDLADEVPASRASRRKQHSAGVHRRRRVVFAILGVIVLVVVRLWFGTSGVERQRNRQSEIVQINQGEGVSSVPLRCRPRSDRQTLPSVCTTCSMEPDGDAGHVLFHQNSSFSEVHATSTAVRMSAPLTCCPDSPSMRSPSGRRLAGTTVPTSTVGYERFRALDLLAAGNNNLEGLVASGTYLVLRAKVISRCCRPWWLAKSTRRRSSASTQVGRCIGQTLTK